MFDVINEQISALFCSNIQALHNVRRRSRSALVLEGAPFVRKVDGRAPGKQPPGESFLCEAALPGHGRVPAAVILRVRCAVTSSAPTRDVSSQPALFCRAQTSGAAQLPRPHRPLRGVHQPFHRHRNVSLVLTPAPFFSPLAPF